MTTVQEVPNFRPIQVQPMPTYSTPSAFDRRDPRVVSIPQYPPGPSTSLAGRGVYPPGSVLPVGPRMVPSRVTSPRRLDHMIENIQGHITALTERINNLEGDARQPVNRLPPMDVRKWDPSNMGLWSIVTRPLVRIISSLSTLVEFLLGPAYAHGPAHPGLTHPSPIFVVIRRLILDATFILSVFALLRYIIRRNGMRNREINAAFRNLFRALIGRNSR